MKSVASVQDQISYKFLTGKLKREHNPELYDAYRTYLVSRGFINDITDITQAGRDFVDWYRDEYVDNYLAAKIVVGFIIIMIIVGVLL